MSTKTVIVIVLAGACVGMMSAIGKNESTRDIDRVNRAARVAAVPAAEPETPAAPVARVAVVQMEPKPAAADTSEADAVSAAWQHRGMEHGYAVGYVAARAGVRRPSNDDVDAAARRAAFEHDVPDTQRTAYLIGYTDGVWMGWRKGL